MKKQNFRHGLSKPFIDALNSEYAKSGWWKRIADDEDLFIGIRNNYLNVYFNGGSILELRYTRGRLTGKTHFKYLLDLTIDDKDSDYIKFSNGTFKSVMIKEAYRDISENLEGIKQSTKLYQGDEKKGVHNIVIDNINVIDTEIQFPGEDARIDFAALQKRKGRTSIVFFEAKTYSNSDIVAKRRPKVLDQIRRYQEIVSRRRDEIEASYRRVLNNIQLLEGWKGRRHQIFAEAALGDLHVDPEVRLVIFGFDDAQKKRADKEPNGAFVRLRRTLGKTLVLTKGDPKRFNKGIRYPE